VVVVDAVPEVEVVLVGQGGSVVVGAVVVVGKLPLGAPRGTCLLAPRYRYETVTFKVLGSQLNGTWKVTGKPGVALGPQLVSHGAPPPVMVTCQVSPASGAGPGRHPGCPAVQGT
jgi:hypothetical protein